MAISFVGSAVNSSSPNTATVITLPTLQADDLIIIAAAVGDTANNGIPAPTGYSRVPGVAATLYANDVNDTNLDLFYKIAVAGDSGATVTLTATGGTNASNAGVAMVFRGVDTTTPFDVNATTATGISTSNADPPSLDHLNPAGVWTVIAASTGHTGGATASFTFPANYTTNAAQRAHNDTIDVLVGMGYRTNPADPEDPAAFSAANIGTAADNGWAAVTMALRPAVVAINHDASPGSYSITGADASVLADFMVNAEIAAYAITGVDAFGVKGIEINAVPGAYALSGVDAGVLADYLIDSELGSYALTGFDAGVLADFLVNAEPGEYLITGVAAVSVYASPNVVINAEPGTYALTGFLAGDIYGRIIDAAPGVYNITGAVAGSLWDHILNAAPGSYDIVGFDAAVLSGYLVSADAGVYALDGVSASTLKDYLINAGPGSYAIVGIAAESVYESNSGLFINAEPGVYIITGEQSYGRYDQRRRISWITVTGEGRVVLRISDFK